MNTGTITCLNYIVHSLVIGAAAWLLVRLVMRDALRRCILANLAVLMCLYTPFDIEMRDLFPPKQEAVPVWTPIRETFKADWRVSVSPASAPERVTNTRSWDVNDVVSLLRRISWTVAALLLLRLLLQSIRVQRWAWRLREPTQAELDLLPRDAPLGRLRVFEYEGSPCVAGWFFPALAVPAGAFQTLTERQWSWLLRHEAEHLRLHDTVAVLLQNMVRAFLWWNPFAHALIEEYARAREEMCDAAAVGEEREHTAYADFLLEWAAKSVPQHGCVMPIAPSRPARRLKARLVALMEARGVRQKVGALFVLGLMAFAVFAPVIAASFGVATAAAQEPVKDDGVMHTREFQVAPDFLSREALAVQPDPLAPGQGKLCSSKGKTARELLEGKGVSFPPGASASFNPQASKLVVRNTKSNLDMIGQIIAALSRMPVFVRFSGKFIQADRFFGKNESILTPEDERKLLFEVSQIKGIRLASSPTATTRFGQKTGIEAARFDPVRKLLVGQAAEIRKFAGLSIELAAKPPEKEKSEIEMTVSLGLDPGLDSSWLVQDGQVLDWDKVQLYSVASKARLASGETLLLHLPVAKQCFTVLIRAEAINPGGGTAESFGTTIPMFAGAGQGREVSEKKSSELIERSYRVSADLAEGKTPVEYLEAKGVVFPRGDAQWKDGWLKVKNTRGNLDLTDVILSDAMDKANPQPRIEVEVTMAETNEDIMTLSERCFPEAKTTTVPGTPEVQPQMPSVRKVLPRLYAVQGVLTRKQARIMTDYLQKGASKMLPVGKATIENAGTAALNLPKEMGGAPLKVNVECGGDGNTLELTVQTPSVDPTDTGISTTGVTLWNDQVLIMGGLVKAGGAGHIIFIHAAKERADEKKSEK